MRLPGRRGLRTGAATGALILALSLLSAPMAMANDMGTVDAAIVLAVDKSASIDPEQADRQRQGHAEALQSPHVQAAIRTGFIGCIAITYVEWSSVGRLQTVLPWTRVCGRDDAMAAARLIAEHGDTGRGQTLRGRTSLSYAISVGSLMLDNFPGKAVSKIIDISGNGTNNDGISVARARSRALGRGHVINAIALSRKGAGISDDLRGYFRDNVIGGAGSFVMTADAPADYARALRRKLILEISGANRQSPLR